MFGGLVRDSVGNILTDAVDETGHGVLSGLVGLGLEADTRETSSLARRTSAKEGRLFMDRCKAHMG